MSEFMLHRLPHNESHAIALPEPRPRMPIAIRDAVLSGGDLKFIDVLQKIHSKMVGWMPTRQLEANIEQGNVLIAETGPPLPRGEGRGEGAADVRVNLETPSPLTPLPKGEGNRERIGYVLFKDKYNKRDDCGIIYQLNIAPGKQRGLVGAALIKAAFERAAYGCRLYCCWCAQDLEANHFWESLGFVPLAFRTGSRKAGSKKTSGGPRIHIFWQRRIREGDNETPYWFPSETSGGALKENRIVLPIPPGTHWSDAKPILLPGVLPGVPGAENPHPNPPPPGNEGEGAKRKPRAPKPKVPALKRSSIAMGGLRFAPGQAPLPAAVEAKGAKPKPKHEKKPRQKNDPKYVAAARELRDRYLEEVNADRLLPAAHAKYDVSRPRQLAPAAAPFPGAELKQMPLLKAA